MARNSFAGNRSSRSSHTGSRNMARWRSLPEVRHLTVPTEGIYATSWLPPFAFARYLCAADRRSHRAPWRAVAARREIHSRRLRRCDPHCRGDGAFLSALPAFRRARQPHVVGRVCRRGNDLQPRGEPGDRGHGHGGRMVAISPAGPLFALRPAEIPAPPAAAEPLPAPSARAPPGGGGPRPRAKT